MAKPTTGIAQTVLLPVGCHGLHMSAINWTVRDLTIDGSEGALGGLVWSTGERAVAERIQVINCSGEPGHGFYGDGTASFNDMVFRDLVATENAGCGIYTVAGNSRSNNCEYYACRCNKNGTYGLWTNGVTSRIFGGWYASNILFGIKIEGIGAEMYGPLVENNKRTIGEYASETAYEVGDRRAPGNGFNYQCIVAGTTAAEEPEWPEIAGEEVTDGSVTWMNVGGATEGNNCGAGIDDRGANRAFIWFGNNINQPMLGVGNCFELFARSDGPGGMLQMYTGYNNKGRTPEIHIFSGSTSEATIQASQRGGNGSNLILSSSGSGGIVKLGGDSMIATGKGHGLGFYNKAPQAKRTVSGAVGKAALSSLLSALSTYGLIDNESTPAVSEIAATKPTLTLTSAAALVIVTGTETINRLTKLAAGYQITLKFSEELTVKTGESNLYLNGDFAATPGDTLTLVCDGTDWYEVARSTN